MPYTYDNKRGQECVHTAEADSLVTTLPRLCEGSCIQNLEKDKVVTEGLNSKREQAAHTEEA